MRKFSDSVKFSISGGGGSCTYQLTPCHDATGSWRGMLCKTLLPETPGTRVPVQILDGYPGTKIPESPSTRNGTFTLVVS